MSRSVYMEAFLAGLRGDDPPAVPEPTAEEWILEALERIERLLQEIAARG